MTTDHPITDAETCEPTPASRADKVRKILAAFYDDDEALIDLLADARHFARAAGLDFAEHDRTAHMHYSAEAGWIMPKGWNAPPRR